MHSDRMNLLVFGYLVESGFLHTANTFRYESRVTEAVNVTDLERG